MLLVLSSGQIIAFSLVPNNDYTPKWEDAVMITA